MTVIPVITYMLFGLLYMAIIWPLSVPRYMAAWIIFIMLTIFLSEAAKL